MITNKAAISNIMTTAEEAILRAKAIAARLAAASNVSTESHGNSNHVHAVLDAAFPSQQQSDPNSSVSSGKRKRWGTDGNNVPTTGEGKLFLKTFFNGLPFLEHLYLCYVPLFQMVTVHLL